MKELMQKHKIKDKNEVAALTCLAYELSRYDTSYATADTNGRYFGIFILPENETCSFDKPGKCRRTCDKFLDDDISDDLKCLKETILTGDSAHNDELERCLVGDMVLKYLKDCEMDDEGMEEKRQAPKPFTKHTGESQSTSKKTSKISKSTFVGNNKETNNQAHAKVNLKNAGKKQRSGFEIIEIGEDTSPRPFQRRL